MQQTIIAQGVRLSDTKVGVLRIAGRLKSQLTSTGVRFFAFCTDFAVEYYVYEWFATHEKIIPVK